MKVLFICTGNTCRSPMAEALLKHKSPQTEVKSAGIYANEGTSMNDHAVKVLKELQIEATHYSQPVTEELLEWADYILTMTKTHEHMLILEYPIFGDKISTLKRFVQDKACSEGISLTNEDIVDPYGLDSTVYRETLSELDIYITELMITLQNRG